MVFNVCPECGAWVVERCIEAAEVDWAVAICSTCGHLMRFRRLPMFVVTGPSGAGKTTACERLIHTLPECVVLESDILWGILEADPDGTYRTYHDVWLRVVKNINQAGRPVVLIGACMPEQIETLPERRYLGTIHYLALVCDDDVLAVRLRARPAWRNSSDDPFVQRTLEFNHWFKRPENQSDPKVSLLDTSQLNAEDIARKVSGWVRSALRHRS